MSTLHLVFYDNQEKTSGKFWDIFLTDNEIHTIYGNIGSKGREFIIPFDDSKIEKHLQKLIHSKLQKGYVIESKKIPDFAKNIISSSLQISLRLAGKTSVSLWSDSGLAEASESASKSHDFGIHMTS